MLQLPVFRSLGECGHPAEMLVGLPLCHQTSRAHDWSKRPARRVSTLLDGEASEPASCFLLAFPLCPQCVEKSRCMGQRTKSRQAIRRHPHCPQEPRILPGCPLFASAFPVRLHCTLASREGVFGVHTAHTVHRRPPPSGK